MITFRVTTTNNVTFTVTATSHQHAFTVAKEQTNLPILSVEIIDF